MNSSRQSTAGIIFFKLKETKGGMLVHLDRGKKMILLAFSVFEGEDVAEGTVDVFRGRPPDMRGVRQYSYIV